MKIIFICLTLILSLSHCTSYDFSRRVIQQGNIISLNKVNKIKVGMSKENVAILMGSSLLSPPFTTNHWDYAYTWRQGSGPMQMRHLVIYFNNNQVVRIEHLP